MTKHISLIEQTYDHAEKCAYCGFRSTTLWNLGEDEPEEYAACGDCTTRLLADNNEYTIQQHPDTDINN